MKGPSVVVCMLILSVGAATAQRETLREAVLKEQGPVLRVTAPSLGPPVTLKELLAEADMVVRGIVGNPTSYLSDDGLSVLTDYEIRKAQVLHATVVSTAFPKVSEPLKVTLLGGKIILEGYPVTVSHAALRSLKPDTDAIFLLQRRSTKYFPVRTYLGAFEVRSDAVFSSTATSGLPGLVRGKTASQSLQEISGALKELGR